MGSSDLLNPCADQILQVLKLSHQFIRLGSLKLSLSSKLLIFVSESCHFLPKVYTIIYGPFPLHSGSLTAFIIGLFSVLHVTSVRVYTAKMLVQVLLARESLAREPLAVWMWAIQLFARTPMKIMYFSLMSQQSARVCKSGKLLASFRGTFVWPVVLVHMLEQMRSQTQDSKSGIFPEARVSTYL